jgi:putative flippase GtrA
MSESRPSQKFTKYSQTFSLLPKYIVVGAITVAINVTTFWIVLWVSKDVYISTLFGNLASALANFSGLRSIFDSNGRSLLPTLLKYCLALFVYYWLSVWMTLFFISVNLTEVLARVLAVGFLFPLGYLSNKYLVFEKHTD